MQIGNHTRSSMVANNMHNMYGNARKRNIHNFDHGGGIVSASNSSIGYGILGLVLKVHAMSRINADVSTSYNHLLEIQFPVLKNSATAFIPPGFISHENAFGGRHKVMEVGIKQFVVPWMSLKAIRVVKYKHVAFGRPDYRVNNWPRSCDDSDEVSIIVELGMACSYLAKTVIYVQL